MTNGATGVDGTIRHMAIEIDDAFGHWEHQAPQARWEISSKAQCARLVAVFDRYPLRAKKAADFTIWRQAVSVWGEINGKRCGSVRQDWTELAALASALCDGRRYDSELTEQRAAVAQVPPQLRLVG